MPDDARLTYLEILKALHQANSNRWEKRRNYEWLLSYGIWGALAGSIVFLDKNSSFQVSRGLLVCWLIAIVGIHALYLFFIVDGTLRDLANQRLIEKAICNLAGPHRAYNADEFELEFIKNQKFIGYTWAPDGHWVTPRHGFIGQIAITMLLCCAVYAVHQQRSDAHDAVPPASNGANCQGCTQNFSQPPQAK
jgi:hypothetical protein